MSDETEITWERTADDSWRADLSLTVGSASNQLLKLKVLGLYLLGLTDTRVGRLLVATVSVWLIWLLI